METTQISGVICRWFSVTVEGLDKFSCTLNDFHRLIEDMLLYLEENRVFSIWRFY